MKVGIKDSGFKDLFTLSARVFAWLKRKYDLNLSDHTFPPDVYEVIQKHNEKVHLNTNFAFADYTEVDINMRAKKTKISRDGNHIEIR